MLNKMKKISQNQKMILELIRENQPLKRAELTALTDLTQQSVHRLVSSLDERGYINMTPSLEKTPGKPSTNLSLKNNASFGVGIVVNTDSVVLSAVNLSCDTIGTKVLQVDVSKRKPALAEIKQELDLFLSDNDILPNKVCGLGFTLPGYFVSQHRSFNAPEPLRDWSLVDLRPDLEQTFGYTAYLENSATAGATGETLGPIGKKFKNFAYLGFDYGFGGAVIIDGKAHPGLAGNAGELSYMYSEEELKHRPALASLLKRLRKNGIEVSGLDDLKHNFDPGWKGVDEWIDDILPQLNRAITSLIAIMGPEAIVFGGQIPPQLAQTLISKVDYGRVYRYDAPPPLPILLAGSEKGDPAASGVAQIPIKYSFFR